MESSQEVKISPCKWADSIEALLLKAGPVEDIKRQVETEGAKVFKVEIDGALAAAFVLRIDSLVDGDEGVIVAAGGDGGDVNLTDALLPHIEKIFQGVRTVRIHTRRHGLAKKLVQKHGYGMTELVLTKKVR